MIFYTLKGGLFLRYNGDMEEKVIKTGYFTITSEMIDLHLDSSSLLIYGFIASYKESGYWGTYETIAKNTGVSASWIRHKIPELIKKGLINKTYKTLETGIRPCLRINNAYTVEELPPIEETKEIKKETEKKPKKQKKETEETKWNNSVKDIYKEIRKKLYEEGKINSEFCAMGSALISTRLKSYREKNIPVEKIKNVFLEMAQDVFCVNTLQFNFEKLLSEKLFFQIYERTSEKQKEKKTENIIYIPKCSKCNGELNGEGLCYICDMEKIMNKM